MSPVGIEPAVPASERPHTHALDRAADGMICIHYRFKLRNLPQINKTVLECGIENSEVRQKPYNRSSIQGLFVLIREAEHRASHHTVTYKALLYIN